MFPVNIVLAQDEPNFEAQVLAAEPVTYLNLNDTTKSFKDLITGSVFLPSSTGTVIPQQPGFDNTNPNNKSALFSYDAYLTATNDGTGDFEWYKPFSILIHINHLKYPGTGTMYFVSKGDVGSAKQPSYSLWMRMNAGQPQLCFTLNGVGGHASNSIAQLSVCTHPGVKAFANGYNYDLIATNDGTGSPTSLQLHINGLLPAYPLYTNNAVYRFGAVVLTVGNSGTGYAASTPFTSSGGGPNCAVSGTLQAQNGVPKSVAYTSNWGCTSLPAITLNATSGAGATLVPVLFGAQMSTAGTEPLIIAGALVNGQHLGIGGTATTTEPQFIDEFAVFPRVLTPHEIQSLFYQTKFYQGLLRSRPKTPPLVVFDNDGCGDSDNIYALALTIAADRLGYVSLAGAVDTDGSGPSMAMYRQMLDKAGLTAVPVAVPSSTAITSGLCTATDADMVNPSTPQTSSAYIKAAILYRSILAENPDRPLYVVLGGSFRGVSDLMQSQADTISPLTGAELLERNALNGGAIFAQGLYCCGPFSGDNSLQDWSAGQYVVQHNAKLPIYWFGGIPQSSGPGILETRESPDPVYVFANHLGTDTRQAYDSLAVAPLLSSAFSGGVTIAIGGTGHGYEDITPFTSSGGGPFCSVTGYMTSVGGVPSTIHYDASVYAGAGWGCSSAPSIVLATATGSGAILTASPTAACGTVSIAGPHSGSTSDSNCSQHYFLPYSALADPGATPIFNWFINSLIDPNPESMGGLFNLPRLPDGNSPLCWASDPLLGCLPFMDLRSNGIERARP
jgi:hypothetical protein